MYKKYLFHICLGTLLCLFVLSFILLVDNNSKCHIVLCNKTKTNISNIKIHYSEEVVPIEIPEMSVNEQYSLTIFLPAHIADGNLFISYCDGNNNEQECKFEENNKLYKHIDINSNDNDNITLK